MKLFIQDLMDKKTWQNLLVVLLQANRVTTAEPAGRSEVVSRAVPGSPAAADP